MLTVAHDRRQLSISNNAQFFYIVRAAVKNGLVGYKMEGGPMVGLWRGEGGKYICSRGTIK